MRNNPWVRMGIFGALIFALFSLGIYKYFYLSESHMEKRKKLSTAENSEFKPGQVWAYKTRSGEESSLLIVVKVDFEPKIGNIVSVYVNGLKVKNPDHPNGFNEKIIHMPFTEKALKESVIKVVSTTTSLPDYESGYEEWKQAFENKDGGVFTVSVAKAIDFLETTLEKGKVVRE